MQQHAAGIISTRLQDWHQSCERPRFKRFDAHFVRFNPTYTIIELIIMDLNIKNSSIMINVSLHLNPSFDLHLLDLCHQMITSIMVGLSDPRKTLEVKRITSKPFIYRLSIMVPLPLWNLSPFCRFQ